MERSEDQGRERILSRIRSALTKTAPKHAAMTMRPAQIFAPVTDPVARFQKECADNVTECVLAADSNEIAEHLRHVLEAVPPGEVYIQDAPVLRRVAKISMNGRPIRWSSEGPPHEASQATITLAESLVASTGSVLVASSGGGRGASIVGPVHIVIASQAQVELDLDSALARANQRGLASKNSFLCLITGSSRTADIEKILVLGAHGPRRLVVILTQHLD